MEFVKAKTENLKDLNDLIVESRSVWNYPTAYAQESLPLIEVNENYLRSNRSFELRDPELSGFVAFIEKADGIYLDHLWIKRNRLRSGLGTSAIAFADRLAQENSWQKLIVYPDPPAEGFYLKNGFVDTGRRLPSRIFGGPVFSVFEKVFHKLSGLEH